MVRSSQNYLTYESLNDIYKILTYRQIKIFTNVKTMKLKNIEWIFHTKQKSLRTDGYSWTILAWRPGGVGLGWASQLDALHDCDKTSLRLLQSLFFPAWKNKNIKITAGQNLDTITDGTFDIKPKYVATFPNVSCGLIWFLNCKPGILKMNNIFSYCCVNSNFIGSYFQQSVKLTWCLINVLNLTVHVWLVQWRIFIFNDSSVT